MSKEIKNVIVIGASGNIGIPIVTELIAAGFTVSALTRASSTSTFPPEVTVHKTDYSHSSLLSAFKKQDAIVSAIATYSTPQQKAIIDAAVEAGVKRFLPSEYGVDTSRHEIKDILPPALMKQETVEYLKTKESSGLSWTAVCVGAWFDWPLELGIMGFSPATRTATIYDSGTQPYEATNVRQVARGVIAVLTHADITANQYVFINSFTVTQNEVLAVLEKVSGGERWDVRHDSVRDSGDKSMRRVRAAEKSGLMSGAGDYLDGVPELITVAIYGFTGDGNGESLNAFGAKSRAWMEKLGMVGEDLEATIRAVWARVEKK